MEPIRPISSQVPELPAVERVWREGEQDRRRQEQERKKKRQQPQHHEPPEDDGRPHIDISV